MTTETKTETLTPFIAISANYYGTGINPHEARKALVRAGGSPSEKQSVFKLPDKATGAYVANNGNVYWAGAEGDMRLFAKYDNGKAQSLTLGEGDPQTAHKGTKPPKGKPGAPKHVTDAQEVGGTTEQPEADIVADMVAKSESKAAKAKKPAAAVVEPKPVVESRCLVAAPGTVGGKSVQCAQPLNHEGEHADGTGRTWDRAPSDKPKKAAKPAAAKKSADKPVEASKGAAETANDNDTAVESTPADFMLFVGSSFYTKEVFTTEAASLGISRRMPSHRLPKGLVCGVSKVFVAAEGARSTESEGPVSEVFGYFIPQRVEFIQGKDGTAYTEIIAQLKTRPDTKIIGNIDKEPPRACGTRKEGGTYIVVDNADTPLVILETPAHYEGNHFRGMMRLSPDESGLFSSGGTFSSLIDEVCMKCGDAMKCAPDGHTRAERERRRILKGEEPKWLLLDAKCRKEVRAARAADDTVHAATEDGSVDEGDPAADEPDMEPGEAALGTD